MVFECIDFLKKSRYYRLQNLPPYHPLIIHVISQKHRQKSGGSTISIYSPFSRVGIHEEGRTLQGST
jgi:hypothetical protein